MAVQPIELDVRPQLRNKLEPFELIMGTVKALKKEDVFILHATIKPTPLLGILKLKGYVNHVQKVADDHWITTFVHKSQKHLLEQYAIREEDETQKKPEAAEHDEAAEMGHRLITLDNRGLEPPQPMIRTLGQLEKMTSGEILVITNDRVPVFLIEELKQMGCTYEIEQLDEGEQARITIKKP
jgi:TusA-related sulfurtransferase